MFLHEFEYQILHSRDIQELNLLIFAGERSHTFLLFSNFVVVRSSN